MSGYEFFYVGIYKFYLSISQYDIPGNVFSVCICQSISGSGSGRRSSVEAIGSIYSPIAWLPPGYEPGAGDGVASAARQRGRFCRGTFWFDDATLGSLWSNAIAV